MTVFWALVAQGVVSVTRILTTITVSGRLAPSDISEGAMVGSLEQLALYYSAFGVITVLTSMHEGFVTTPLTVFLPKQTRDHEPDFSGKMLLASMTFIGISVSAVMLWVLFRSQTDGGLTPALTVIAIAVALAPLQLLREFSRRWLIANLRVMSAALFEILFSVTYLSCLAFLLLNQRLSAIAVFSTIASVNVLALAAWWSCFRPQFSFSRKGTRKQLLANFRYGRWAAAENFSAAITMFFPVWYLSDQMGKSHSGAYSACFNVIMLANPFLLGICSLLGARAAQEFTRQGWEGMLKTLSQYGTFIFVVLVPFSAVLWVFGAELTNMFFGDRTRSYFAANAEGINSITAILGLSVPFAGLSFVLSCALMAIERPWDNFYCAFAGMIVLISVNCFFGPSLQTAAISFVVANAVNVVLRVFCLGNAWMKRDPSVVDAG